MHLPVNENVSGTTGLVNEDIALRDKAYYVLRRTVGHRQTQVFFILKIQNISVASI